jgi:hypothetical protein
MLNFLPANSKTVLDIGCGSGNILYSMKHSGMNNLKGIDPYIKEDIKYVWADDSYFSEMKHLEIERERMMMVEQMDGFVGKYFSRNYIKKKILQQTDDEIEEMQVEMEIDFEQDMQKELAQMQIQQNGEPQ